MKWKDRLLQILENNLGDDESWAGHLSHSKTQTEQVAIHLAVFTEPVLSKLLNGEKTIESRFSINKVTPFGKVHKGDIIIVKKSGGPVVAVFIAGSVRKYQNLTVDQIFKFREQFSESLGMDSDDTFWSDKANAKYATFINVTRLKKVIPFSIEKKDRTAWAVIKEQDVAMF
jgi:hypothetical protein